MKKKIIIVGSVLILLTILSMILVLMPSIDIDINGNKIMIVNFGDNYDDNGAEAHLSKMFSKKNIKVNTTGLVNTSKIGDYVITYHASYKWLEKDAIRIVRVIDTEAPTINVVEPVKICVKNNLVELKATALDNLDGDISDNIKYRIDKNMIFISVADSSNNVVEVKKELAYIDAEKPKIKLNGEETVYIKKGEKYTDAGATAYDSCDGNITKKLKYSNNVNENELGTYEVNYSVSDTYGNTVSLKRSVIVLEELEKAKYAVINGGYIYLTFDDGPGPYTEAILDTLRKYNVKATFFVTNQFGDKYQYLIKKEYEEGHTIGVHTYSHKWSIYDSVDAYLDDFNKMAEIVKNQTGMTPKYFRFPGGSSNTVSRSHSKGIMTTLAALMQENGYKYYDWTFDSGDTSKNNNSEKDILNNVKARLKGDGEYVVLMHDIKKNTMNVLPSVIEYALQNGYTFRAIDDNSIVPHLKIAN